MSELFAIQKAFTEHLRNPDVVPVPEGLDKRRMGIYSSLIFNNLSSLLADFFPVLHSILDDNQWQKMVRDYFIGHQSQTPYFPEIAEEFVNYLSAAQLTADYPDFTLELAHYEWVELVLFMMDVTLPETTLDRQTLQDTPIAISTLAQPLVYRYPVHRISPDFTPKAPPPEPTYLLVTRDQSENVRFYELQPLAFQLLHDMHENASLIPREWLTEKAKELDTGDERQFVELGLELLDSFNGQHIFFKAIEQ